MNTLALYFNTLRYLRPVQIAARIWSLGYRPRLNVHDIPPRRIAQGVWVLHIAGDATLIGPNRFRLLEVERCCTTAADWDPPDATKLWTYNLHYFDDLTAVCADERLEWHRVLLLRWVEENLPGCGVGWEPYPISRRIVNWIKWVERGNQLPQPCHTSLAVQARWLRSRLEYHLLGNHLLANAKALIFAGCYFSGAEPSGWLACGLRILDRELREQILMDGGHFELSPMYHATVLEDLLDIVNILRRSSQVPALELIATIERMRRWLRTMCHPDEDIAFFNDAALQIAPSTRNLDAYADRLELSPSHSEHQPLILLEHSGYVRMSSAHADLLCDCAAVGPDYLPGHAHADTLSFELSIGRQRVLVNSGTSEYGTGNERQRQRGTPAHNTVTVDGQNSSEVWAGFRVARRARPNIDAVERKTDSLRLTASHDGYRRLRGKVVHQRSWMLRDTCLDVTDRLIGRFAVGEAHVHLHPAVLAELQDDRVWIRWDLGVAELRFQYAAEVELREGTWHPRFGAGIPNRCIVARFAADLLTMRMTWAVAR